MSVGLVGFGTAVPDHTLSQADAAELHTSFCAVDPRRGRALRAIYRRSGISLRHLTVLDSSDGRLRDRQSFYPPAGDDADRGPATEIRMERYESDAPRLAVAATRSALDVAGVCGSDVTHLVTVSCTGFMAPGVDTKVIEALGMAPATQRTHVGFMGCHGALNGLRVAQSFIEADSEATVVVCSVELCSLHFGYGRDPGMLVANALFADGAAAVVGRAALPTEHHLWRVERAGTLLLPDSVEDMSWRIGDHGFRMTLSARVPHLISEQVGDWLLGWLAQSGITVEDVGSWAVHPGGPRILDAVERAAGLDRRHTAVSREVLADHGNMSSATVLFILDRLQRADAPRPCVALAFGPGLVLEAALIV